MTSWPCVVCSLIAIWLPIVPLGTNNAASRPKISAARRSSRLILGSSPYTSSPTSASNMARRISGEGLVTVSLRRSMKRAERAEPLTSASGAELYISIPSVGEYRTIFTTEATENTAHDELAALPKQLSAELNRERKIELNRRAQPRSGSCSSLHSSHCPSFSVVNRFSQEPCEYLVREQASARSQPQALTCLHQQTAL